MNKATTRSRAEMRKLDDMPSQLAALERGGRWKVVSAAWDHSLHAPLRWDDDGQSLTFAAEHEARNPLWRFDLRSRGATRIFPGGWVQGFDVANGVVAVAADAMDHPARVHALRDGEPPRRLERFNDDLLATLKLGTHEDVRIKGAQGDEVQMWLVYPPGFDPRKNVPGLLAGCLLVFAVAASAFVTQTLVGGGQLIYMPFYIYQQAIQAYRVDKFTGWITDKAKVELSDVSSLVVVEPVK